MTSQLQMHTQAQIPPRVTLLEGLAQNYPQKACKRTMLPKHLAASLVRSWPEEMMLGSWETNGQKTWHSEHELNK